MRINKAGLKLVQDAEGYYEKAYLCPANVWTIGWGTTRYPNGQAVKKGDTCTRAQAEDYLAHDMQVFEKAVSSAVKVGLNENQFSALVSLAYNIGAGAFRDSTLVKRLNAGEYGAAAAQFSVWNKGGGKVLAGLVKRRAREAALFSSLGGSVPVEAPVKPAPAPIKKISTIAPPTRGDITHEEALALWNKLEGAEKHANDAVKILWIRGYWKRTMGDSTKNDRKIYDDLCVVILKDRIVKFNANTDPNGYRKGNGRGSKKGMATLQAGKVFPAWNMGKHKGQYAALIQTAGKVTVHRDADDTVPAELIVMLDGVKTYLDTGSFGINQHRGGMNGTSSLGCLTIYPPQYNEWQTLVYKEMKAAGQKVLAAGVHAN